MQILRFSLLGAALLVLAGGLAWAEDAPTGFPAQPEWDPANPDLWATVDKSGSVTPLRLSSQDVSWDGSGSVSIPFTINQRARVWLAVYEIGSNETGVRGPFGAWFRAVPQDLFVASTGGQAFEAGNNVITWNGLNWEGNAAGPGNYEFDLFSLNVLDKPTLAGPAPRSGFHDVFIDLRTDPPEIWAGEYDRQHDGRGHLLGDMIRGTLGTDYVANPTAWERWSYNQAIGIEGGRTFGGLRADPDDPEAFYSTHWSGEGVGVYKLKINRSAKVWDRDESWADNGFASTATAEMRLFQMQVWENTLVGCNNSMAGAVPVGSVEFWDRASGEIVKQLEVAEWFTRVNVDSLGNETLSSNGPTGLWIDASGILLSHWGETKKTKIAHDGATIWVNDNGDGFGDRVTYEMAAETGMTIASGSTIRIVGDTDGKAAWICPRHNNLGYLWSALGRDGAGLFHVFVDATQFGPIRPSYGTHMVRIDHDRSTIGDTPLPGPNAGRPGPWDGMYWNGGGGYGLLEQSFERPTDARLNPGALFHVPYDMTSGRLGAGVTVVEAVESAGTPDSYSLSAAYPNPFNPETTIEFAVATDGYVEIDVYNAAGQQVASLVDEELSAGAYRTTWDALDQNSQPVSSGVYFYRMQAGDFAATHSMTLLK